MGDGVEKSEPQPFSGNVKWCELLETRVLTPQDSKLEPSNFTPSYTLKNLTSRLRESEQQCSWWCHSQQPNMETTPGSWCPRTNWMHTVTECSSVLKRSEILICYNADEPPSTHLSVLSAEPRALRMLSTHPTTEVCPQPQGDLDPPLNEVNQIQDKHCRSQLIWAS